MFVSRPSLGAGGGRGGKGRGGPRGRMAGPARRPPPVRGGSRPPHGAGGAGSGARAKGSQGGTRPARRRGGAGDGGGGQGRGTGAGAAGRPGVGRVGARRTSPAAAPEGTGCASIIAMGMMMAGVLDSLLGSCPLGDRGGGRGAQAGGGRALGGLFRSKTTPLENPPPPREPEQGGQAGGADSVRTAPPMVMYISPGRPTHNTTGAAAHRGLTGGPGGAGPRRGGGPRGPGAGIASTSARDPRSPAPSTPGLKRRAVVGARALQERRAASREAPPRLWGGVRAPASASQDRRSWG